MLDWSLCNEYETYHDCGYICYNTHHVKDNLPQYMAELAHICTKINVGKVKI